MEETVDDGIYAPVEPENVTKFSDNAFRSDEINFLPSNIELIRNRFVFKKLEYENLTHITVRDGYLIKNRWIIRILSVVVIYFVFRFMSFGLSASGGFAQWNLSQWFNKGSLLSVWGPLLITIGALMALSQSFIKSPVLVIKINDAKHIVRIKKMEEDRTLEQLLIFLNSKGLFVSDNRKVKRVKD